MKIALIAFFQSTFVWAKVEQNPPQDLFRAKRTRFRQIINRFASSTDALLF
jgi:hypothetical protein